MSEDNNEIKTPEMPEGTKAVALEGHRPEDIAAAFFKMEKPRLKNILSGMSTKQIRRFVMHVAAYPLTDPGDMPRTEEEKRAAYLFNEMVMNKAVMLLSYELQQAEKAHKQMLEQQATENVEPKGDNNGEEA